MVTSNILSHHPLRERFATSHAFLVGINHYDNTPPLVNAISDIQAIGDILEKHHDFVVHLYEDSTFDEVVGLLEVTMPAMVKKEDRILFYFAGHGIAVDASEKGPEGYILPKDTIRENTSRSISMHRMLSAFEALPCRHFLLILDCCFSGAFRWSALHSRSLARIPHRIYQERFDRYVLDPAWQVITSSAYHQEAIDIVHSKPLGRRFSSSNSPFAQAFINALEGAADLVPSPPEGPNGLITATELYLYLRDTVEAESIHVAEKHRQTPSIFPLSKHDKGEFLFLSPKNSLNLPHFDPRRNPYKGLKAYEKEDKELFFGREREIEELVELVRKNPFVVVSGVSGTGKSSLVKAGVLPSLEAAGWTILPAIRPGEHPLEKLQEVVSDAPVENQILFVDQFEELITLSSREDREAFLAALYKLIDRQTHQLKTIVTVRADFEPHFRDSILGKYWRKAQKLIASPRREAYRELIVQPALQQVLHFDPPELVDEIVEAVVNAKNALPLLSFTLSELFEQYRQFGLPYHTRALTKRDYERLGGVMGGLRNCADRLYENMDDHHQAAMQQVMLRMVTKETGGELEKRRPHISEFVYADMEQTDLSRQVIEDLVQARLVVKDEDGAFVELAHEALIQAWPRLWDWKRLLDLSLRDSLIKRIKEYQELGEPEQLLFHDDPRLDNLEAVRQSPANWMNKAEEEFLDISYTYRHKIQTAELKRKQRNRRIYIAFTTGLAIFGIAAAFFWYSTFIANSKLAKTNEALTESRDSTLKVNIDLFNSRDSVNKTNFALEISYDSLENAHNRISYSLMENARARGDKAFESRDFSTAVAAYSSALEIIKGDSLLKPFLPIINQLIREALDKKVQYVLYENHEREATILLEKDQEGENFPIALSLFNTILLLRINEEDKALIMERKNQLLQRIDLASQRAESIASRSEERNELCWAFKYYRLANHIKPDQSAVTKKIEDLHQHIVKTCPDFLDESQSR